MGTSRPTVCPGCAVIYCQIYQWPSGRAVLSVMPKHSQLLPGLLRGGRWVLSPRAKVRAKWPWPTHSCLALGMMVSDRHHIGGRICPIADASIYWGWGKRNPFLVGKLPNFQYLITQETKSKGCLMSVELGRRVMEDLDPRCCVWAIPPAPQRLDACLVVSMLVRGVCWRPSDVGLLTHSLLLWKSLLSRGLAQLSLPCGSPSSESRAPSSGGPTFVYLRVLNPGSMVCGSEHTGVLGVWIPRAQAKLCGYVHEWIVLGGGVCSIHHILKGLNFKWAYLQNDPKTVKKTHLPDVIVVWFCVFCLYISISLLVSISRLYILLLC